MPSLSCTHACFSLSIAMPDTGVIALHNAVLHNDARQYLNQIATTPELLEMDVDTEKLPPTAQQQQHAVAAPRKVSETEHIAPPMSTQPEEEMSTVIDSGPPSTAATSTTQTSPRKVGESLKPSMTSILMLKLAFQQPRRRADMARRDPLEDIFGPSSAASTAVDAIPPSSGTEGSAALQTQRPAQSRPKRNGDTLSKRPRISETWRSIFDSGDGPEVDGQQQEGISSTALGDTQSRTRKFRKELDEADRLATQLENTQASQDAGKRRARSPPAGQMESAKQRRRLEEEDQQGHTGTQQAAMRDSRASSTDGDGSARDPPLRNQVLREKAASSADTAGDTDSKFLQAMSTSKRNKKGMDQFDRDFNLLRIVKPVRGGEGRQNKIIADVEDPEYRAWEQMGPSDFDINAAGNFVQVDFVPLVYQRSEEEERERNQRLECLHREWQGRPNFKRFRAKQRARREPLAMKVDDGVSYGTGEGYIKGARASTKVTIAVDDNDDDDEGVGGTHEVELMGPPPKQGPTRAKTSKSADLFSDEEVDLLGGTSMRSARQSQQQRDHGDGRRRAVDVRLDVDADLDDSIYSTHNNTLRKSAASGTSTASKRSPLELCDDDDEGESSTFSGFRARQKRRV